MYSNILRAICACALFLSFSLQAVDIPETERDRITQEVITELGRYDAAEIEKRSRLWLVEQPLPAVTGELVDGGSCVSGCRLTETRGTSLPEPRNVDIKAKKRKGKYSPNLRVKWKRPKALKDDSPYRLSHYLVHVSKDNTEYKTYRVDAQFKNNGKPKNKQKINFRKLPDGDYLFQVQAIYEDTTTRKDSKGKDTPAQQIYTRGSSKGGPVQNPALTVGHLNQPETLRLYNCLKNPSTYNYSDSIELDTIQTLDCSGWNLQDSDIKDTIDNDQTNNLDDRYDLSDLTSLSYLDISNNPSLTNLYDLYLLPSLSWLDVSYNTNLVFIWNLAAMDTMIATHMGFNVIPPNSVLPSDITYLDLSNNPITANLNQLTDSQITTLKINDNMGSPIFTQLSGKNIETLELKNSSLTKIGDLSGINGLKNLILDGSNLDGAQDISNYTGFCSLSLNDTSVQELDGQRPIFSLSIENDVSLTKVRSITQHTNTNGDTSPTYDIFMPFHLRMNGSNNLRCAHKFGIASNLTNYVDMGQTIQVLMGNGQYQDAPFCVPSGLLPYLTRTLELPTSCKPNPPSNLKVYEHESSPERVLTWEVNPAFDLNLWGATGFEINAYDVFGNLIETYFSPDLNNYFYNIDSIAAAYYEISICTANTCGDKIVSSGIEQGLAQVQNLESEWNITDPNDLKYRFKFSYPQNAFDNDPYGRPDYFKVSANFTQPQGNQSFTISAGTVNGNEGPFWVSPYIDQDFYLGQSFRVQACNTNLGCGATVPVVLSPPLISELLPQPIWTSITSPNTTGATDITLSWHFGGVSTDLVDYIKIIETQPNINVDDVVGPINTPSFNGIEYYTENINGPLGISRVVKGNYEFTLYACKRDRENGDVCSQASTDYNPSGADHVITRSNVLITNNGSDDYLGHAESVFFNPPQNAIRWQLSSVFNQIRPDYFYFYSPDNEPNKGYCVLKNNSQIDKFTMTIADVNNSWGITRNKCKDFSGGLNWKMKVCKYGAGCTDPQDVSPTQPSSIVTPPPSSNNTRNVVGGPGDLHPGVWRHDDSPASGWYFYWATRLDENNQPVLHSKSYDLIGYWFTYESINEEWTPVWYQARMIRQPNTNYFSGAIIGYTKNISSGSLTPVEIGQLQVHLNQTTSRKATLHINMSNSNGLLTHLTQQGDLGPYTDNNGEYIIELEDFAYVTMGNDCVTGSQSSGCQNEDMVDFGPGNDIDHYSGIWQKNQIAEVDPDFTVLTWIERDLEFSTIATFDTDGLPIWMITQTCDGGDANVGCNDAGVIDGYLEPIIPNAISPFLNMYAVNKGATPFGGIPIDSYDSNENPIEYDVQDHLSLVGWYGREYRDGNTANSYDNFVESGVRLKRFPENGSCPALRYPIDAQCNDTTAYRRFLDLNYDFRTLVYKTANLHGIAFEAPGLNSSLNTSTGAIECDPNTGTGACEIRFSWFTDDDFPDIRPFVARSFDNGASFQGFEPFSSISGGFCGDPVPGYSEDAHYCTIDQAAIYKFELRKPKYAFSSPSPFSPNQWVTIAEADHPLKVLQCTSGPCQGDGSAIPVRDDQVLVDPVGLNIAEARHDAGAGPLPGSGSVSGGAATYNIPLVIPPGRNGMAPELSVNYSSRGGNGVMGVGWSLSAGSNIYRCAKTLAQDGGIEDSYAVTLDASDRLCLDGQRLMVISNQNNDKDINYWLNASEYRTEQDSFARITKLSDVEFKVETKSGMTRIYKQMTSYDNSVNPAKAYNQTTWYLTEEYDSFGNLIEYTYHEGGQPGVSATGTNEWLLTNISYSGYKNGNSTSSGNRTVTLEYLDRGDDYNKTYLWGQVNVRSQKLDKITTAVGSQSERIYQFSYRNSMANDALLLTKVEESADNGLTYRTLAKNSWSDDTPYDDSLKDWQTMADNYTYSNLNNESAINSNQLVRANASITSDFDGDGIKEHIVFPRTEGSQADAKILFFNPNGSLKAQMTLPDDMDDYTNWVNVAQPGDFNADGYTDFVIKRDGEGFEIYSWNNSKSLNKGELYGTVSFSEYFNEVGNGLNINYTLMDFDPGDQMIFADPNLSKVYFIDFNNDGKQDILLDRQPLVGDNGGDRGLAELALYINTTTFGGSPENINVTASVAEEQIILEHQPSTDWEPETDIRAIIWERIEGIEDLNGDSIPDVRMKRLVAIGELPPLDSGLSSVFIPRQFRDVVEFFSIDSFDSNGVPQFSSQRESIDDLGLKDFTCLLDDTSTSVDCVQDSGSVSLTGGRLNELDMVNYRFVDINNDGLKDFLYYNLGYATLQPAATPGFHEYVFNPGVEKYWKVRLNRGGLKGSATLFDAVDIESTINSPENAAFIPDPGECSDLYEDNITNYERREELLRICHPIFRSGAEFSDINGDGISELLYPDYSSTGLVFNHCTTPPVIAAATKNGGVNFNTVDSDQLAFMQQISTSQLEGDLSLLGFVDNIINKGLPDDPNNPTLDCLVDNCGVDILNRSLSPVVKSTNRGGVPVAQSCSATQLDVGLPSYYDFDFSSYIAPVKDNGVYKYKAIEFNLKSDGTLGLEVIHDTGLYKSLKGSNMGDLNGDGLLDDFAGVGCTDDLIPSCTDSKYLSQNAPSSWNFNESDFTNYGGFALMTRNQATMPNMLTMVEKSKPDVLQTEWITWDYAPISESEDLYTVDERHSNDPLNSPDGYINDQNAAGEYFYFYSSMYVVEKMMQSNGTYVGNGIQDFSTTQFKYMNAVYNNEGRGFQGFNKIYVMNKPQVDDISDHLTTTSVSTFHQIFPLAGKLESIEVANSTITGFDTTHKHHVETFTWTPSNESNHSSNGVVYYPLSDQLVQDFDLGSNSLRKEVQKQYTCSSNGFTSPAYDHYGNNECEHTIIRSYDASSLMSTETVEIINDYNNPILDEWWIDQLNSTETIRDISYHGIYDDYPITDSNHNPSSSKHEITAKFYWENNGTDRKRKLTCQVTKPSASTVNLGGCSQSFPSGNTDAFDVTRVQFVYDQYGNVTNTRQEGMDVKLSIPGGDAQEIDRPTSTSYGVGGYFPVEVTTGAFGESFVQIFDYDPGTGRLRYSKDPNGIFTVNNYDSFDMLVSQRTCLNLVNQECPDNPAPSDKFSPELYSFMYDCNNGYCAAMQSHLEDVLIKIREEYSDDAVFNQGFFTGSTVRVPILSYVSEQMQAGQPSTKTYYDANGQATITETHHSQNQVSYTLNLTNPIGQQEMTTNTYGLSGSTVIVNDDVVPVIRDYPYSTVYAYDVLSRVVRKETEVGNLTDINNSAADDCSLRTTYIHDGGQTDITAIHQGTNCEVSSQQNLEMKRLYDASGRLFMTESAGGTTGSTDKSTARYWYDDSGNPLYITDHDNNTIVSVFDDLGRKRSVNDPNMKFRYYSYNSFGEIRHEWDGLNRYKFYEYDTHGRITQQHINTDANGNLINDVLSYQDIFTYGGSDNCNITQLCQSLRLSNESGNGVYDNQGYDFVHQLNYSYDQKNRMIERDESHLYAIGASSQHYSTFYHYDENYNRLKQVNYMNDLGVHSIYTSYGALQNQFEVSASSDTDQELLFNLKWNLQGQVVDRSKSDGTIFSNNRYYAGTGQMAEQWHTGLSTTQQWTTQGQLLTYGYDAWGNLTNRGLSERNSGLEVYGVTETLDYDKLHRLTFVSNTVANNKSYKYDVLGNLIHKSDFNSTGNDSEYGINAGPNAISRATLRNGGGIIEYAYDQRGNRNQDMIGGLNQVNYDYDGHDLMIKSVKVGSGDSIYFRYGVDNQRYYKHDTINNEVTLYGGKDYERIYNSSGQWMESKFYITDYLTISRRPNQDYDYHYVQKDRLGSTTQILNQDGNRIHAVSYDAFGKPRNGDWTDKDTNAVFTARLDFTNPSPNTSIDISKRGFTDHEHLDDWQLIHMNGRMFDFNNGRFVSVDPFIQNPSNSQSLNPYTYIFNNPLSGVDPSGYEAECNEGGQCTIEDVDSVKILDNGTTIVTTKDGDEVHITGAKIEITNNGKKTEITAGIAIEGKFNLSISELGGQTNFSVKLTLNGGKLQSFAGMIGDEYVSGEFRDRIDDTARTFASMFDPRDDVEAAAECLKSGSGCVQAGVNFFLRRFDKFGETLGSAFKSIRKNPCNCFVAGTQVLTEGGLKPIEEVEIGDMVWAKDPISGQSDWKEVVALFTNTEKPIYAVEVEVDNNQVEIIESTDDHPYFVVGKGWIEAIDLQPGEQLESNDGKVIIVNTVKPANRSEVSYNFTVENYHTYYVTEYGVLVHNCNWEPGKNLWSKGKLKEHYEKHGSDFGVKNSKEYGDLALQFGKRNGDGITQTTRGAFIYKYEPSTNTVFVGTAAGGKIKSFYKWDGRANDEVIKALKEDGKL